MNAILAVLKSIRDVAKLKLAAAPVDDAPTVIVAKKDNVVPIKPKQKPGLLERLQHAGDYDDAGKPTYSMPLVHTHNSGGRGTNINDDPLFNGARWRDEATENYRADSLRQWRPE
jgi:hypothetical protein